MLRIQVLFDFNWPWFLQIIILSFASLAEYTAAFNGEKVAPESLDK
jgi:hypothetical protein